MTDTPADQKVLTDGIRPLQPGSLREAARVLFDAYRVEPAFAQLYGFKSEVEAAGTLPIFDGICRTMACIPGANLGYYRQGQIVGVVSYYPNLMVPVLRHLTYHPLTYATAIVRSAYIKWRSRPRLATGPRARWRTYNRLARAQGPKTPRLHILALGVSEPARGTGIARQLIDAVADREPWRDHAKLLQVETWHPKNVSIYERLGFHSIARGTKDGVDCWTMVRPIPKAPPVPHVPPYVREERGTCRLR